MKATKTRELDAVFEAAVKFITGQLNEDLFNHTMFSQTFASEFQAYGTWEGENFRNFDDLKEFFHKVTNQGKVKCVRLPLDSIPVFRSYSPDGKAAVYVDEINLLPDFSEMGMLRLSIVFYKMEQGWQVTHIHASKSLIDPEKSQSKNREHGDKRIAEMEKVIGRQNSALKKSTQNLDAIKTQLLRQEKLASLGQLTAGIAHEIKNPLNFINNFSEIGAEFIEEIEEIVGKMDTSGKTEEILELLEDVKVNLKKIHHHGTRADGIVKSMLLHSRGGSGNMEDINLNELIKEYVNLSFHGMRANKNPINVDIKLELEESLGLVKINPENFSRVILNLCKNAFDAMRDKLLAENTKAYLPQLIVRTKTAGNTTIVEIEDNGPGVTQEIKEKMMLPFFTTKKGSEGTGLGLSISHDIIKSHGGTLELESKEGEYTKFIISLDKTL